MVNINYKDLKKLSEDDLKREKKIINKLNLTKLPFKISKDSISDLNIAMIKHSRSMLKYQDEKPGIKWCFSSIKKLKVFLAVLEANERGEEIYKEKLSNQFPEYSYKTIAQIIDEGISKNFFLKLPAKYKKTKDLKIRNVRPSEEIIVEFVNWKIDLLISLMNFKKNIN
jgi:hypothetical protein